MHWGVLCCGGGQNCGRPLQVVVLVFVAPDAVVEQHHSLAVVCPPDFKDYAVYCRGGSLAQLGCCCQRSGFVRVDTRMHVPLTKHTQMWVSKLSVCWGFLGLIAGELDAAGLLVLHVRCLGGALTQQEATLS